MFANQVLFRYGNVAGVFIGIFGMPECCSLHFNRKITNSVMKLSNSEPKATKIIKILDLFRNADMSKKFCQISMFS